MPVHPSILVTFAVKEEAKPFQRRLTNAPHIRSLITGMGKENAGRTTRAALDTTRPDLLITAGFAGGLNPALPTGSVIFEADENFPRAAVLLAAGARPGRCHCAERVIITAMEKQRLRATTGADAVEMESETIRALARSQGIPSATVRVISDAADEDLPLDFNALVTLDGRPRPFPFALALIRQPWKIDELIRFQKRVRSAAERLTDVLEKYCRLAESAPAGARP